MPNDRKASIVIALHKKGSKSNINNYRSVSLTSVICKVLESILVDKIMEYILNLINLLSNNQFGFIRGRLVNIQLINLLDKWTKHLDNNDNKGIDVIYKDFKKAFDKVPHERLIYKLKLYSINNLTLNWIKAYLDNKKHRVSINNHYSD